MTYTPALAIEVSAWGRVVGYVAPDPSSGVYAFEYDDRWVDEGAELAPLYMPRRRGVYLFPDLPRATFYGLPALLADALPDRFGNALVNAWMAEQGVDRERITPLDRLAYASDRAMGALTFRPPAGPPTGEVSAVQLADLVAAARAQISGSLAGDEDTHRALAELISVGSSAGGARAKAVLAFNPTTGQMRSGQFAAPAGFEQWLLKLDGVGDPAGQSDPLVASQEYCRVEYAYYLMATSAGVSMSESQLLPEGPRAHFMTRRFDRGAHGERIHLQTLCALAHLDYNARRVHAYSSYFLTARALGLGPDAAQEIFRRAAFNVFGVNRDDHAKNFSFLLPEHGAWRLAPAYDVTHSNWGGSWTQNHQMSVNGRFVDISLDDLRVMGDRHEVPGVESVLREVASAVARWRDFAAAAGVDGATTDRIATDFEELRPR
ncbi:MAG: type II toxin-antitoxin system HipA family toxin [Acidimicrobiales bacterium]